MNPSGWSNNVVILFEFSGCSLEIQTLEVVKTNQGFKTGGQRENPCLVICMLLDRIQSWIQEKAFSSNVQFQKSISWKSRCKIESLLVALFVGMKHSSNKSYRIWCVIRKAWVKICNRWHGSWRTKSKCFFLGNILRPGKIRQNHDNAS